jgi:hypothetical protein
MQERNELGEIEVEKERIERRRRKRRKRERSDRFGERGWYMGLM